MQLPDFVEWSKHILDRDDVAIALEQAFNQGRSLGHREGLKECQRKQQINQETQEQ